MTLEPRLLAVAQFIQSHTHVDIGSDHALLPKYLLEVSRIQKAIVIEKTLQPFETARAALEHYPADVRLGDGLGALDPGEADSLSISGMGASKMVRILQACPERLPSKLTFQPNDSAKPLRIWAREAGFELLAEDMVKGYWRYTILHFAKSKGKHSTNVEASYESLPLNAALTYGPYLLKAKHVLLREELEYQLPYLQSLGHYGAKQLEILEQALNIVRGK
jgi:tRNA (adenine22-N1)-methyltransferase